MRTPAEDIISLVKPGDIVCEIGCRQGFSTKAFLLAKAVVYTIDPWKRYKGYDVSEDENSYKMAVERLAEFGDQVAIIKMKSSEALPYIPMCDLVWIDGNHAYEYIRHDIKEYWEKVKPGGYLSGHDYTWESVYKAVHEHADNYNLKVLAMGVREESWAIEKG